MGTEKIYIMWGVKIEKKISADGQKPCSGGKGSFPACRAISSAGSSWVTNGSKWRGRDIRYCPIWRGKNSLMYPVYISGVSSVLYLLYTCISKPNLTNICNVFLRRQAESRQVLRVALSKTRLLVSLNTNQTVWETVSPTLKCTCREEVQKLLAMHSNLPISISNQITQ